MVYGDYYDIQYIIFLIWYTVPYKWPQCQGTGKQICAIIEVVINGVVIKGVRCDRMDGERYGQAGSARETYTELISKGSDFTYFITRV